MIHNANNSMDTAVTGSTNSMHCLNTIVASPPASASAVPVGGPTAVASITPATVVNNNNNNTNASQLIEEIASENYWLREKVKEINADRDRLLCEVANLRLELDMAELKRLPEDRWVIRISCIFYSCPFIFSAFEIHFSFIRIRKMMICFIKLIIILFVFLIFSVSDL